MIRHSGDCLPSFTCSGALGSWAVSAEGGAVLHAMRSDPSCSGAAGDRPSVVKLCVHCTALQ